MIGSGENGGLLDRIRATDVGPKSENVGGGGARGGPVWERRNSSSEITNCSHLLLALLIDNKVCYNYFAMPAPIRVHTCMARSESVLVPASVSPLTTLGPE